VCASKIHLLTTAFHYILICFFQPPFKCLGVNDITFWVAANWFKVKMSPNCIHFGTLPDGFEVEGLLNILLCHGKYINNKVITH